MIDLKKLTAQERNKLLQELQADEQAAKEKKRQEREQYKELVAKIVAENIKILQQHSSLLSQAKANVFNNFTALLELKKEIYGFREGQQSHTFSDDNGNSIEIGSRVIDSWDDTVEAGIAIVNKYINSLATNEETAKLVHIIHRLLKKDAKGNLKANRVLELQKLAEEINDVTFTEGVEIIRNAYKPVRSAWFIEASVADAVGKKFSVPLSITSVPFPNDFEIKEGAL